jgi:hypothetical protein
MVSLYSNKQDGKETFQLQREKLANALNKIESIQDSLSDNMTQIESSMLKTTEQTISQLEGDLSALLQARLPPVGLSVSEYEQTIEFFRKLPLRMRLAICIALELEPSAASDWNQLPDIVTLLFERSAFLTPKRLCDSLDKAKTLFVVGKNETLSTELAETNKNDNIASSSKTVASSMGGALSLFQNSRSDELILLPPVTRKEERTATEQELQVLLQSLKENPVFSVREHEPIQGGYIIRGQNRKQTGSELVASLEELLPSDWPAQVCYVPDVSLSTVSQMGQENVLILLKKDMSPTTSPWLFSLTSALAVLGMFLYCFGVYGWSSSIADRIGSEGGAVWFNNKILEIIIPLFGIQLVHELGRFMIASRDKIQVGAITLLPFWGLPFGGAMMPIKESPKDMTSLFDFAFVGSFLGILASLGVLAYGLQMTALADPATLQFYAALPVRMIRESTLAGTIIDSFLGGSGFVTLQDPSTPIPLHPLAIAGFAGVIINAIELLPFGASNGGRIALCLFGRLGFNAGGILWILLLIASFFTESRDFLFGAWVLSNFFQSDSEIPCRNEVDQVDLLRVGGAIALWAFAICTLTPI